MNMPQNGVAPRSSDQLGQILRDLETELRQVSEQPAGEQDFERVEGELHQLFAVAERATLAHELERLDVDRPEVSIEGRRHRHVVARLLRFPGYSQTRQKAKDRFAWAGFRFQEQREGHDRRTRPRCTRY